MPSRFYFQLSILPFQLLFSFTAFAQTPVPWQELDPGLQFAEVQASQKSDLGDSRITILRVDPEYYQFKLLSAKELDQQPRTAKAWAEYAGLTACINAGMYQMDFLTNTGYMKNFAFINNPGVNADNAVIAFNPISPDSPSFQIIDRQCQDWELLKEQYQSLSQGIRMINCQQHNVWSQQAKKWSIAAMAADKKGRALFLFCRSPYSVHDFIAMILALDLDIDNAMYLEGGPEASFYLHSANMEVERFGSYETGFNENDLNDRYWDIPNVIGILKK